MRLLTQILNKKLESYGEHMITRSYLKAIWQFYCSFNLSIAILGIKLNEKEQKIRNKLYRKLLYKKFDQKGFRKIQVLLNEDMKIIIQALDYLEKEAENPNYELGSEIDKPDFVGMLSFDFEAQG